MKPKAHEAPTQEVSKGAAIQLIVFQLGEEEYALPISQIKEVVHTPPVTPMPQTPRYIQGVANIRGNVIAMVDLEEKLGKRSTAVAIEEFGYTLVVSSEELHMGILVRELPNTLTVYESDMSDPGNLFQDAGGQSYIKGIVKLPNRLLLHIDITRLMKGAEE